MLLRFTGIAQGYEDDFRFTVGKTYEVIGSVHNFGKIFYTIVDDTKTKMNIPLNSRVYKFEVEQ